MKFHHLMWIGITAAIALPPLMGSSCAPVQDPPAVQNIAPADAKAMIDQRQGDASFVLMDVRNPEEFAGGHLAGAVNVCYLCTTFADQIAQLDKSLTYLVYCASGHRSLLATEAMRAAGFTSLYNAGKFSDLQAAGLPVEQ
jgi:rhodanese-related sulfurtransferase